MKEKRAQLGDFIYDDKEFESRQGNCELRPEYLLADGSRYLGEWLVGTEIRQGKGVLVRGDGGIVEGYFLGDKINGKSRAIYADGFYEGNWKNGKWEGKGVWRPASGGVMQCEYKNGVREGKGMW